MAIMAKVLLCLVPWLCSVATMDSPPVQVQRAMAVVPKPERPCVHCPVPGKTMKRIVRVSYVPEVLRTVDEL
jgi:hypothetical protein